MTAPLLIRTDANTQIGTGHLMRCLSLAEPFQAAGIEVRVALAETPNPKVGEMIRAKRIEFVVLKVEAGSPNDAMATVQLARDLKSQWLVVDGYQFGSAYQDAIEKSEAAVLFIDDYGHCDRYVADWVLNQNAYAEPQIYKNASPRTRLLLGPDYTLIRREFLRTGKSAGPAHRPVRLLITLGGADPDNVTALAVDALSKISTPYEACVLIGAANPYHAAIASQVSGHPNIRLETPTQDMPSFLQWADFTLCAGGTTGYELAFMGVPSATLILTDNQILVAQGLHDRGCTVNLGEAKQLTADQVAAQVSAIIQDPEKMSRLSAAGKKLIDGLGTERVFKVMTESSRRSAPHA